MSKLLHLRSGVRVGVSMQAVALALLISNVGVAKGQDGLGLGTGTASCQLADTSTLTLYSAVLPIPPLPATGSLNISLTDTGVRCDIVEFDPINIAGVGFVCITPPEEPCEDGFINCPGFGSGGATCTGDCDGDGFVNVGEAVIATNIALGLESIDACPAADANDSGDVGVDDLVDSVGSLLDGCPGLGVDVVSNHIIGPCTGNEDCITQCEAYCDERAMHVLPGFGCEGFCDGGEMADQPCLNDAGCPGGSCNGADTVPFGNVCECQCVDASTPPPATEGSLSCNLGSSIVVETGAPCGGGDVLITVGTRCIPLTTDFAETVLLRANGLLCWGNAEPCGSSEDCPTGQVCSATPQGMVCGGNGLSCQVDEDCPMGQTCGTAQIGPLSDMGSPANCEMAAEGSFSGTKLRGFVNFFGSTIGDLVTKTSSDCE